MQNDHEDAECRNVVWFHVYTLGVTVLQLLKDPRGSLEPSLRTSGLDQPRFNTSFFRVKM